MLAIALPLLCFYAIYRPLTQRSSGPSSAMSRRSATTGWSSPAWRSSTRRSVPPCRAAAGNAPLSLRMTEAAALAGVSLTANEPRGAGFGVDHRGAVRAHGGTALVAAA
jgi:hypothetical protein